MRSQQYYDRALNTAYPFDDGATLIDDYGKRLPEGLLADISCVIDRSVANRVFCSYVSKRNGVCNLIFNAANNLKTAVGLCSFAVASLPGNFELGKTPQVAIRGLKDDFRGRLVPGDQWLTIEDGSWQFSDPSQSHVSARCCLPLLLPGQQTVSVMNAAAYLTGIAAIQLEGDIDVVFDTRTLNGEERQAVVFSLKRPQYLQSYAGTTQARPEARTCGDPQPIETINGVRPNCCGQITFELRGCAQPVPINNHCGVVLDCPLTLNDTCPPATGPRYNAAEDACAAAGVPNALDGPAPPTDAPKGTQPW